MTLTKVEYSLDSEAIGAAAAMREGGPDAIAPARLHELAQADAEVLLKAWRNQTVVALSLTACLHMDEKALAGAIFRHAMLHAGAFIDVDTQKPYDRCPRCGSELKWPEN